MKKLIFALVILTVSIFAAWLAFSPSSGAQRKYGAQWEYAAITYTATPLAAENQATMVGVAGICYLKTSGCQTEEVKAEVVYLKFIQDFRLENTGYSKTLAYNRARDLAYSKAVARLGLEGWELIAAPPFNFDAYISDGAGAYSVVQGGKEIKPNVYFKRLVQ